MLEPVSACEAPDLLALHDSAIIVHEFRDHADRWKTCEPAKIDRGLGVAGSQQHAAVARDQGKDVAWARKIAGARVRVGKRAAAGRAFLGRNAGAAVGLVVDRDGKSGGMR